MPEADPEFDEYAEHYGKALDRGIAVSGENKDFFARGRVAWLKRRLEKRAPHVRVVLDYGCGTGSATPFIMESFRPLLMVGVDISPRSLAVAEQLHGSTRTQFTLYRNYVPTGHVDLAYCNGVFHHIPLAEREECVRVIYRSLRPGGYFALWENNPWNPGARWVMKRIPFDRDAIMLWPEESRRLMRAAGFEVVDTNFLFIFPNALRFLRGSEPALCQWPLGAQYMVLVRKPG